MEKSDSNLDWITFKNQVRILHYGPLIKDLARHNQSKHANNLRNHEK